MPYHFSGYATRNDLRCTDGRVIRKDAFADDDGERVPLVWQHRHDSVENVIGHADLENREDGVYMYGEFNDTRLGKIAKQTVLHGDLVGLSIYAGHVVEHDKNVMHGKIKEVSLVLSGANPGAYIDNIMIEHAEDGELEMDIYNGANSEIKMEDGLSHSDEPKEDVYSSEDAVLDNDALKRSIAHADDNERTIQDVFDELNEKQQNVALYLIGKASNIDYISHEDDDALSDTISEIIENELSHEDDSESLGDIFNTFTEEQKNVVYYLMAKAIEENKNINHSDSDEGGNETMKYNVFEQTEDVQTNERYLSHADEVAFVEEAKKVGSLREAYLAHTDNDHFIKTDEQIGYLFPDDQLVNKKIEIIRNNPTDWVAKTMNGVHKSPFSRIKMISADITADEARARGYVKGQQKVSEVVALAKRSISPTTVYKLQKIDRDDIIDITDMDIVAWIKAEMRIMMEEELARDYTVGDFRSNLDENQRRLKVDDTKIIPILKDYSNDFYAYRYGYTVAATEDKYAKFIDEVTLAMVEYEGSGSPVLYTTPEDVARMMLIKDSIGNRIYKTRAELASAMGVKEIIEHPYMKDQTREEDGEVLHSMHIPTTGMASNPDHDAINVKGIVVNLADYTVGADKGGALNMFDDFDINFNQYEYLMETRQSGALTKHHSAILIGEFVDYEED